MKEVLTLFLDVQVDILEVLYKLINDKAVYDIVSSICHCSHCLHYALKLDVSCLNIYIVWNLALNQTDRFLGPAQKTAIRSWWNCAIWNRRLEYHQLICGKLYLNKVNTPTLRPLFFFWRGKAEPNTFPLQFSLPINEKLSKILKRYSAQTELSLITSTWAGIDVFLERPLYYVYTDLMYHNLVSDIFQLMYQKRVVLKYLIYQLDILRIICHPILSTGARMVDA